jgi:hypothetical protein
MAVDSSTAERVKGVLTGQLGDDAGAQEAERWREHYANQPGSGLVAFVQELARRRGLDPNGRQRLRMELVKAVHPEEAGDTTYQPGTDADSGESKKSAPRSPGQQVCAALVVSILGQSRSSDRGQVLAGLVRNLAQVGEVPQETVKAFSNWDGNSDPPVASSDDALRGIVHAGYLSLCEVYGPAEADRMLRRCIQRVESMAAAVEYPPRRLL